MHYRLFLAILFSFLMVVGSGAVALGDLLVDPSSAMNAGNFGKAVRGVATHSADDATGILSKMAKQEFGVTALIKVIDAAKWKYNRAAGITGFVDGKLTVRILNGPLNQIAGTM